MSRRARNRVFSLEATRDGKTAIKTTVLARSPKGAIGFVEGELGLTVLPLWGPPRVVEIDATRAGEAVNYKAPGGEQ